MKSSRFDELARELRGAQDDALARRSHESGATEATKERLREAQRAKPVARKTWRALAVAAVLVLGIAGGALAWPKGQGALAFQIGDAPGTVGGFIRASADAPSTLRFSDASTIAVAPNGRARVVDVDANGARIVLESGTAHATITHRAASKWHVIAGPFDVVVTGTEFDVAWDPTSEQFSVAMKHGTVHVEGTLLGDGHVLTTGQRLDVSLPDGVVHEGMARTGATVRTTIDPPQLIADPSSDDAGAPSVEATADHRPAAAPHERPAPAWVALAQGGDYAKAVSDAEAGGFDLACSEGKPKDVLALGDAARFTGHADEARAAYESVRSHASDEALAAEAAFDLGKLAFDREHDYAGAARWFETYEAESPNGPLALEAAGRLLEAKQKAGDTAGASDAAKRYLARYPDGPRAALARSLAGP